MEEQAGTSDISLTICLAAAISTGHELDFLSVGTPNCTSCVWLAVSDCQTLILAGSTLVSCMLHSTAALEAGCAARLASLPDNGFIYPGDVPPPADKGFSEACPQPGPIFVMTKTDAHPTMIMYPDFTFLDWVVSQA